MLAPIAATHSNCAKTNYSLKYTHTYIFVSCTHVYIFVTQIHLAHFKLCHIYLSPGHMCIYLSLKYIWPIFNYAQSKKNCCHDFTCPLPYMNMTLKNPIECQLPCLFTLNTRLRHVIFNYEFTLNAVYLLLVINKKNLYFCNFC